MAKPVKEHTVEPTWQPYEEHGRLTMRTDLPETVFAFPRQRKEPLTDEKHVRNAVARFDQVIDASEEDRALAFANIEKAARYYDVNLSETNWRQLGVHPQHIREAHAAKAVETKREQACWKKKLPKPLRRSGGSAASADAVQSADLKRRHA